MSTRLNILRARLREWLAFDSVLCASVLRLALGFLGILLYGAGSRKRSFRLMSTVHRMGRPRFLCSIIQRLIKRGLTPHPAHGEAPFDHYFSEHIETSPQRSQECFVKDPNRMIKNMAIVVASAESGPGRGVIILNYNHTFPLFARQFDLQRIAERYHIVLEPSWTGFCNEDLLCYTRLSPTPVFVESIESWDNQFLDGIDSNLIRVPVAGNWWVDYRVLSPDPTIEKDLDFIMVAAWAEFKRHHRFFKALQTLRRNGHRLRGACVGYPAGLTLAEIKSRADHYGVRDQIEFHESVRREEVAKLMNRAKVNVLWSRKEGFNRVVIEGMFCDVPCILRVGHNYGDSYPYINEETGRFSTEQDLPRILLKMTQAPWSESPAKWVKNHMAPQLATQLMARSIQDHCIRIGEIPPENLAVKTVTLNGMDYWESTDLERFGLDYDFLRICNNKTDLKSTTTSMLLSARLP